MFSDISAEWCSLGSIAYRKRTLYDMNWQKANININYYQISGSPFGGPIALYNDDKSLKNKVKFYIYTSSGLSMVNIDYELTSRVVGFNWTDLEQFVIVHENGNSLFIQYF